MSIIALLLVPTYHSVVNFMRVRVVEIELGPGVQIRPALADSKSFHSETFKHMIHRLQPYAAINGTFYNESMKPLGDILINGKLVNRGHYRNAMAVTDSGKVVFIKRGRHGFNWSKYRFGLASGPMLVSDGAIVLNPHADGFKHKCLGVKAWRSGVGLSKKGKLLLITAKEPLTLLEFARLMRDRGAVDALNLDGGGACGLYHKGKVLSFPSIPMTNLLVIYKKGAR